MSDFHEVSINLNGVLRLKKQDHLTDDEAEEIALKTIQELLSKPFSSENDEVSASLVDASVWGATGSVNVGNLFFDVLHDTENQTSCVLLDIKPEEGSFGSNRVRSQIKSYVTPYCATIAAMDNENDVEKPLVTVGFNDGQLSVFLHQDQKHLDPLMESAVPLDSVTAVDGCVSVIN